MRTLKRISSRKNPTFGALKALAHSGRERRRTGQTILDGVHLIESWLASGGVPELVAVGEGALEKPEIARLAARVNHAVVVLSDALLAEVSPVETASGILARVSIPRGAPAALRGTCVVLDGIQDPGNAGAILRCAAAAGVDTAVLAAGCAQAWSPRVLRAGMGAHFVLSVIENADVPALLAAYPGRILATAAAEGRSLFACDLTGETAWIFGAEGCGISPALLAAAHERMFIPMANGVESLNVAAAAAVCLFEQHRQRSR
ncbi:MAG TPA: RNA methyltransferase [Rhodocyclaceae bacterium]|nr:MAG: rRNA methyltransferase [Betaproteobacteria bacterium CG2_30_68_42]PIV71637.1 MAG: RNA methyltransferase [Rhodocyclales bacterium CG17_big_fil_post_rev_8_21_14_2_50_68_7]PIX76014.1 MAG: RNA methyltransferase [Rhodocyclales bacterium CG_4_10_14_3_um_filter_68_10]PJA57653.1 MAG: RNA methyltransferase [Rhodocyclales bacterium CG_4_9_14_3_um_filter_68_10]HCX33756.1 RNA methyltransferase [Rhodocyclaceae bacterium]